MYRLNICLKLRLKHFDVFWNISSKKLMGASSLYWNRSCDIVGFAKINHEQILLDQRHPWQRVVYTAEVFVSQDYFFTRNLNATIISMSKYMYGALCSWRLRNDPLFCYWNLLKFANNVTFQNTVFFLIQLKNNNISFGVSLKSGKSTCINRLTSDTAFTFPLQASYLHFCFTDNININDRLLIY